MLTLRKPEGYEVHAIRQKRGTSMDEFTAYSPIVNQCDHSETYLDLYRYVPELGNCLYEVRRDKVRDPFRGLLTVLRLQFHF